MGTPLHVQYYSLQLCAAQSATRSFLHKLLQDLRRRQLFHIITIPVLFLISCNSLFAGVCYTTTSGGSNWATGTYIGGNAITCTSTTSGGSQTFNYSGGLQYYTVPSGVSSITIRAAGAQGGAGSGSIGGYGAVETGTFSVTPGQVLTIMVGGQGGSGTNGGGGGGTFVTNSGNSPFIIAGGGGGGYYSSYSWGWNGCGPYGSYGSTSTTGSGGTYGAGSTYCGNGGAGPNGGNYMTCYEGCGTGAGGGGLTGNGGTPPSCGYPVATGGKSFTNGGAGGVGAGSGGAGGYGGGGGADWEYWTGGGGGGGYGGGGGGVYYGCGGGGGSYNAGSGASGSCGANGGNGSVTISYGTLFPSTSFMEWDGIAGQTYSFTINAGSGWTTPAWQYWQYNGSGWVYQSEGSGASFSVTPTISDPGPGAGWHLIVILNGTSCGVNGTPWVTTSASVTYRRTNGPLPSGASVSSSCWTTNGSNTYTVNCSAQNSSNNDYGGPYGILGLVNYQGTDAGAYGGYFSWNTSIAGLNSGGYTINQYAASGGGYVGQYPGYGNGGVTLTGGSISYSGYTATASFNVVPNAGFPAENGTNAVSVYSCDPCSQQNGWYNYQLNFSSSNPTISGITPGASAICGEGTTTLTGTGTSAYNTLTWYTGSGATGNNLGTANPVTVGPDQTYYAYVTNLCGAAVQTSTTVSTTGTAPTITAPAAISTNKSPNNGGGAAEVFASATGSDACSGEWAGGFNLASTSGPLSSVASNLKFWVKGDAGVVKDGNGLVSEWRDISGNSGGNKFYQGTAGARPARTASSGSFNGYPVITFSSTSQYLAQTTSMDGGANSNYTIFVVDRLTGSNSRLCSSNTTNWLFGDWGGSEEQCYCNGWISAAGGTTPDALPHMYELTSASNSAGGTNFYDYGNLVANGTAGSPNGPGALQLNGYSGLNELSTGEVAEVIYYNTVLTTAQRQIIEGYLAYKYNLPCPMASAQAFQTFAASTTCGFIATDQSANTAVTTQTASVNGYPGPTVATPASVCTGNNVTLTAAGMAPAGSSLTTGTGSSSYLLVGTSTSASNVTLGTSWTLEGWVKFPLPANTSWNTMFRGISYHPVIVERTQGATNAGLILGTYQGGFYPASAAYAVNGTTIAGRAALTQSVDISALSSGWHHIASTGTGGNQYFYVDGVFVGKTGVEVQNDNIVAVGNYQGGTQDFGTMDEVKVYNIALPQNAISNSMTQASTSSSDPYWNNLVAYYKMDASPVPNSATGTAACSSCNGTVQASATTGSTATAYYTYSWSGPGSPSFSPSASSTSESVTITAPTTANSGNFSVTAAANSVNSNTTTVPVTINPNATISLTSAGGTNAQTVCYNTAITNITYAVGGGGTGAGVTGLPAGIIGSYSGGVFTISGAPSGVSGTYNYTVTTTGTCVQTSATGSIVVDVNLTASQSGGSSPVCYNTAPGTFTASGSGGTGSYTYLWYKNGSSTGITTNTYAPGNLTATSTIYCAVTSGGCGTVNTSGATITVYGNLTASQSGGSTPLCYNTAPGTFTVTAGGGTGSYTYMWYLNGSPSGVTTTTYAPGSLTGTSTIYCAVTSGSCGTVNTTGATITVYGNLSAVQTNGTSPVCYNSSPGTFTATGSAGTGSYTYQWYTGAGSISAATASTYSPGNITATTSYYVAVTSGSCGTVNTTGTNITVYPNLTAALAGGASPICYNTSPGIYTATGSGGNSVYTYQWYNSSSSVGGATASTYTPPALTGNNSYYCAVTSGAGCGTVNTGTASVTVEPPVSSYGTVSASGGLNQTVCDNVAPNSGNPLAVSGAAGSSGSFTYQWYYQNGLIPAPSGSSTAGWTACGSTQGTGYTTANFTAAGGSNNITYACFVIPASPVCGPGQWATNDVQVTVLTTGPQETSTGGANVCLNGSVLLSSNLSVVIPATYQWYSSTSAGFGSPTAISGATSTTYLPPTSTPGTLYYEIVATFAGSGCAPATSNAQTVTVYTVPSASISGGISPICYNTSPGTFTAAGTGGSGSFNYQWYNSAGSVSGATNGTYNPGNLTASNAYHCSVTDVAGCGSMNTSTTSITVYGNLTAAATGGSSPICYNTSPGTFTATASGATGVYTYQWYNGSGSISGATSSTFNPGNLTASNAYFCAVTSGTCGTINTSIINITVRANLTAGISGGTSPICYNTAPGTFRVIASGGSGVYTYQWYNTAGSITGATASTYAPGNLTASDAYHCNVTAGICGSVNTATISITVDAVITGTINGGTSPVCYNTAPGTFTATGNGGTGSYTYQWYNSSGVVSSAISSTYAPAALTSSDSYYCAVTSGSCGTANTSTTAITVEGNLTAVINGGTSPICYNSSPGTFTATGNGGTGTYSYQWYNASGSLPGATASTYTPGSITATNDYHCSVTSGSCGTVSTPATTISVYPDLTAAISGGTTSICYNTTPGTFTATGSGGTGSYTYQWFSSSGQVAGQTASTYAPAAIISSNAYHCAVTSGSCGTANTSTAGVTVNPHITAPAISSTNVLCNGAANGTVTVTTVSTGGTPPLTYSLNSGTPQSGTSFTGLAPNNYSVVTRDAAGCYSAASNSVNITEPATLGAPAISSSNVLCNGAANGVVTVSAIPSGGTSPYTYSLNNGNYQSGTTFNDLTPNNYYVIAKDANGCISPSSNTATITEPAVLGAATISETDAICNGASNGVVTVSTLPSGGTAPFSYSLNNGAYQNSTSFTGLLTGNYSVVSKDANGCVSGASNPVTISEPAATTASAGNGGPYVVGQSISLTCASSGAVSYQWSGPQSFSSNVQSPVISGAATNMSGTYTVTATNSTGCTATATTNVAVTTTAAYTWTGAGGTNWTDPGNWSPPAPAGGPNACAIDVVIPNTANAPVISSGVQVGNVQINTNAQLTLNSANINVCKNWIGSTGNAAVVTGTGVIVLNGSTTQTISGNTRMKELMADNAAGVNMLSGSAVDIFTSLDLASGNFNAANGVLTFKSQTIDSVGIIDNFSSGYTGTLTGNITAERYYANSHTYDQHFMGSPINAPALSQFNASGTPGYVNDPWCDETRLYAGSPYGNVFSFHETHGSFCGMEQWKVETTGNAQNGMGYSLLRAGDGILVLNGAANLNSSYSVNGLTNGGWSNTTVQHHLEGSGWQLLSNPYLATLNLTDVPAGFDNQVQVWNANGPFAGSYQPGTIGSDAVIAPFQAFMVHKTSVGGTATYVINASERVRTPHIFYLQNANQLNIVATNTANGKLDQTTVAFNPDATDTFDVQFDAAKFPGLLNRHTLYTANNGKWMSRNTLHDIAATSTVPMGFEPGATGSYKLSFNDLNTFDPTSYIYLEDKTLGVMYNVRNGDYMFTADSADNWDRFVLHFTPAAQIATTDASCTTEGIINIQQPGTADWNYTLTDASNAIITSGILNQSQQINVGVAAGTYLLTLIDTNNYSVTKTIIVNGAEMVTAAFNMSNDVIQVGQNVTLSAPPATAISYNWNFGNGTSGTGSLTSVTYMQPGVYTVSLSVTNQSGCSASKTQTITVTSTATGLNNVSGTGSLKIWSHANKVYVDFTGLPSADAIVIIYDILGQEISNEKVTNNTIYQRVIDNIEAAYLIVMVKNDNEITTKKVFITNIGK